MSDTRVGEVLRIAQQRIAAVDARVLLCHVTGRNSAYLIARPEAGMSAPQYAAYVSLVERRAGGEPVAYLTGEREFYGRSFRVTPSVLIPRPETELLVDLALERIRRLSHPRVLDLGTGSGCIAVSIGSECSHAKVVACDQSLAALAIARENSQRLGARTEFSRSDWYSALQGERFDLIVSNPPYVAAGDPHLREGDLRFEPPEALAAGPDGLDCIRAIVAGGAGHLVAGGWLLVEHGHDQAAAVRSLFVAAGYAEVFSVPDLAAVERVTGGRLTVVHPSR